jgi:benzaldehyde dehydrogenase (NAD)
MELLGTGHWTGSVLSGGWLQGGGETYASVEPATGQQLVEVGAAAPQDVRRAVQRAGDTQPAWAARPYDHRAAVLRAADLLEEVK